VKYWKIFMEESKSPEYGDQLLIAEFNALYERAKSFEEIKAGRVNFFLFMVGALGAGFSAAAQIQVIQQNLFYCIISIATVLFLVGISTLKHSVEYSVAIISFFRRAGRVRRWFFERNKSIAPYLAFHAADDRPTFNLPFSLLLWRGAEPVVIILNAVLGAIIIEIIAFQISNFTIVIYSISAVIFVCLIWLLQLYYVRSKMSKLEKVQKGEATKGIHFPYKDKEFRSLLPNQSDKVGEH
jgi:hypothetical protein